MSVPLSKIIRLARCWTGRLWINIGLGWFAVGFGPRKFVERVFWRGKMIYPKIRPEVGP